MNQLVIKGIAPSNLQDDRTILILDVTFNDEIFDWQVRVPPSYTGIFSNYVDDISDQIFADIENKMTIWQNLSPKTQEIVIDNFGEEQIITVPIHQQDIVKPTYPDYYVLRANEYPSLAEQLDAVWKGGIPQQNMQQRIDDIKAKYPKPI
jgi:capsid portal protein